jgi:hypothetical protein
LAIEETDMLSKCIRQRQEKFLRNNQPRYHRERNFKGTVAAGATIRIKVLNDLDSSQVKRITGIDCQFLWNPTPQSVRLPYRL